VWRGSRIDSNLNRLLHLTTAYPPGLRTRAISVKAESGESNQEMTPSATRRSIVCDAKGASGLHTASRSVAAAEGEERRGTWTT
jgi:hypothetical protein